MKVRGGGPEGSGELGVGVRGGEEEEEEEVGTWIFGALVMHEVMAPAEASVAVLALKRLLTFVNEHMRFQLV